MEFPPQLMSFQPCCFVYIASFQSAIELPLTPCGRVFHASFRGPISLEAPPLERPITITCLTQFLHSSTGLHIDKIIIHVLGDVQPNHRLTNQFSTTNSKAHLTCRAKLLDLPSFHQVSRLVSLLLTLNYPHQACPSHHNCMTLMMMGLIKFDTMLDCLQSPHSGVSCSLAKRGCTMATCIICLCSAR